MKVKVGKEAAKNRVGRNDRLGRGNEERKSPGGQEVESKQERAKDRVSRNDRLSPGGGVDEKVEVEWRSGSQMA